MAVMYYDVCDTPFKRDSVSGDVSVLRADSDGSVYEDEPTAYEASKFDRNWRDSSVISEEIACRLAIDPSLSY